MNEARSPLRPDLLEHLLGCGYDLFGWRACNDLAGFTHDQAEVLEVALVEVTDVDAVLTTRELTKFLKLYGVDMHNIQPEVTDSPLGFRSTAGKLFGASGGVMEAAIRTAYEIVTGRSVPFENLEIKRDLFKRIETVRKPGTIVSSNTSGIPLKAMSEGLSNDFRNIVDNSSAAR